ncbi:MAG: hypothetical protein ACTSSP_00800 [Candidatus Asgardarchaeia archaeon]
MKCLKCGYCCDFFFLFIVDDPSKGISTDNLTIKKTGERCPHLRGDKPGKFSCAIHDYPWYEETPCFSHGQIERNINDKCRMGVHILKEKKHA